MTIDGTRNLTTMPRQKGLEIPLAADERIFRSSPGGWREHVRSGWRLGKLHLTNKRLLFSVQTGVAWEISLSDIHSVAVEQQKYIGGRVKDAIVVIHQQAASKRAGVACIIMNDLETWRSKLSELTSPEIDEEDLKAVLEELSPAGRAIVECLWENGHATISELTAAIGALSNMDVLLEIKDSINPAAQNIIGSPLLVFERAKVDESTGEKTLFSWWPLRRKEEGREERQPLVDIFDEGDHVDILVELAGVREEDILLGVSESGVVVSAEGSDRRYREEIPLPPGVSTEKFGKTYSNNILLIRLQKLEG